MKTDQARTLDTYEAEFLNENPPRREEITEIQFEDSGDLLCYANPEKAQFIVKAVNHHEELVAALEEVRVFARLSCPQGVDRDLWQSTFDRVESVLTKLKG